MTTERENVIDFVNPYFDQAAFTQSHQPVLWSGSPNAISSTRTLIRQLSRNLINPFFDQAALIQCCQHVLWPSRSHAISSTHTLIRQLSRNSYLVILSTQTWIMLLSCNLVNPQLDQAVLSQNPVNLYFYQAALMQPPQPCTLPSQHTFYSSRTLIK